jgi:hypothetical protein
MFHRLIISSILVFTAASAYASQTEQYRGILHHGSRGATLEEFHSGNSLRLSGTDASFTARHDGRTAIVTGEMAYPTGDNEPPVIIVDKITVTAPRIVRTERVRTDGYRPPANASEAAADGVHQILPLILGL